MRDLGSIPGLERSPGEGKGSPLQYSGLEKPMAFTVHGVAKSQTRLSDFHFNIPILPQLKKKNSVVVVVLIAGNLYSVLK